MTPHDSEPEGERGRVHPLVRMVLVLNPGVIFGCRGAGKTRSRFNPHAVRHVKVVSRGGNGFGKNSNANISATNRS